MKGARYAVQLVKTGQSMAVVSSTLSISNQTFYNSVKADREGKLLSEGSQPVTEDHMEFARLRAELVRLKMERNI
jgi:transposase